MPGLDFDFVAVDDELSAEAEGFPLEDQVDEFDGLTRLIIAFAVGDLPGVKLE